MVFVQDEDLTALSETHDLSRLGGAMAAYTEKCCQVRALDLSQHVALRESLKGGLVHYGLDSKTNGRSTDHISKQR